MSDRPTGTVTFLFTDIEGSTRLWEERPNEMRAALVEHDALVRDAIATYGGYVFSTGGDGFAAAFARAQDAVDAARKAQASLAGHPLIRVRMGIHTGEVQERDGDYFGPAVNRAARIMAAGHGGQVLVSATTASLLDLQGELRDVGEHRLRDLMTAERLFQLGHDEFGPLRTLSESRHNLPAQITSFIGRDDDLQRVVDLVRRERLVTLTGVGGVGKTRLALHAAAEVVDRFTDGVWFVDLAPLGDGEAVATQVLTAVRAPLLPGRSPRDSVVEALRRADVLVVLDNCEHVLDDVAALAQPVMQWCPRAALLATSREGIAVDGEHIYAVRPLSVGDDDTSFGAAVSLFADRARAANREFEMTPQNVASIAAVCRRLDGIPLAIELAAARTRSLTVSDIEARMDQRFALLSSGGRRSLKRHQTLHAAIDWSYGLLDERERTVLGRLSVFAGSFAVHAAEQVASRDGERPSEIDRVLSQLVDKSLVQSDLAAGSTRYRLLETIREYALDRLRDAGDEEAARTAHSSYYADVAEAADREIRGPGEQIALRRLRNEADNLRAAFEASLSSGDLDTASRIARGVAWAAWIDLDFEFAEWSYRLSKVANSPGVRQRILFGAVFNAGQHLADPDEREPLPPR